MVNVATLYSTSLKCTLNNWQRALYLTPAVWLRDTSRADSECAMGLDYALVYIPLDTFFSSTLRLNILTGI